MHSRKISITFKSQEYTFGKFPQTVIKGVFGGPPWVAFPSSLSRETVSSPAVGSTQQAGPQPVQTVTAAWRSRAPLLPAAGLHQSWGRCTAPAYTASYTPGPTVLPCPLPRRCAWLLTAPCSLPGPVLLSEQVPSVLLARGRGTETLIFVVFYVKCPVCDLLWIWLISIKTVGKT